MLKMGDLGDPREPLITTGRKIDGRSEDSDKNRGAKKGERKRQREQKGE